MQLKTSRFIWLELVLTFCSVSFWWYWISLQNCNKFFIVWIKCYKVNHTSGVTAVTPTDRPKSVRNCCVIEVFGGVFYVGMLFFGFFCGCKGFCHRTESELFLFLLINMSYNWIINTTLKIVAAFRGMHVSPAKHSFGKCDRKVWQTDRQTDGRTTDKVIPMCRYASQATQKCSNICKV